MSITQRLKDNIQWERLEVYIQANFRLNLCEGLKLFIESSHPPVEDLCYWMAALSTGICLAIFDRKDPAAVLAIFFQWLENYDYTLYAEVINCFKDKSYIHSNPDITKNIVQVIMKAADISKENGDIILDDSGELVLTAKGQLKLQRVWPLPGQLEKAELLNGESFG